VYVANSRLTDIRVTRKGGWESFTLSREVKLREGWVLGHEGLKKESSWERSRPSRRGGILRGCRLQVRKVLESGRGGSPHPGLSGLGKGIRVVKQIDMTLQSDGNTAGPRRGHLGS